MVKPTEQIRLIRMDVISSLAEHHEVTLEYLRKNITIAELERKKKRITDNIMKPIVLAMRGRNGTSKRKQESKTPDK